MEPKCQSGFFSNYRNLSFSRILKSHSSVAVQFPRAAAAAVVAVEVEVEVAVALSQVSGQVSKPLSAALTVYNDASIRSA